LVGLVLCALTVFENSRLAVVPPGTKAGPLRQGAVELTWSGRPTPALETAAHPPPGHEALPVRVASNRHFRLLFAVVLLVVVFGTNVLLRGLWSLVAALLMVMLGCIFMLLGWWHTLLHAFGALDIYINGAGYLFISGTLFLLWALAVFFFDQR